MKASPPLRSIRRELTVQILVGTLALLLVAGAVFLAVIHRRLVDDFDRMLEAEAATLARATERKRNVVVWDVPETYSTGSRENSDPAYCQLFLTDGTVVGQSQTLGTDNLPHLAGRTDAIWNGLLPNGRRGRLVQKIFHPVADNSEAQPASEDPREQTFALPAAADHTGLELVLVVARSRDRLDALLAALYLAGAAVALALAVALAWLVRAAVGRGLRPIEEINAQIAAIAPHKLAARLHIAAVPCELAAVETTVNRLLERLERAFEKERQFSNDLAHELRTPIAELRAACEVAARWPDDAENARLFFQDARLISLQLEKIVATLLALARSADDRLQVSSQPLNLQSLMRACWRGVAAAAAEKQLQFDEHIAPELIVHSDPDQLAMILRNLAENAVAHSTAGTLVECRAALGPNGVELRLANTARDLERADLARVFDRLWRKDPARSDRNHTGLGLAIARGLGELLGLRLSVALRDDRRFEVCIVFPGTTQNISAPLRKP